ncbi:MAG: hypothetical protein ACREVJ_09915, partial [Gammaproteobacteria bacterium]
PQETLMSEDATLAREGAPGMDALNTDHETETPEITEGDPGDQHAVAGADSSPAPDEERKSRRGLALEAINANRIRELETETGQVLIPADAGASQEPEQADSSKRRVKVDGEDIEVTDDELVREYQKGRTADRRLEQAAQARKDLEAERAQIAAERAELERMRAQPQAAAGDAEGGSQATPIDDADNRTIYEALVSGDEEAALNAIKQLRSGRPEAATNATEIASQVRRQIAWEAAQGKFTNEYQDIIADPLLREIAANTLTETLKTAKSYDQAFQEAGDRTRAWVRGVGGTQQDAVGQPPTDPGLADKQTRKERIDNPTAINARAAGKPQEQAETPRDVIKQMRESRGLPA